MMKATLDSVRKTLRLTDRVKRLEAIDTLGPSAARHLATLAKSPANTRDACEALVFLGIRHYRDPEPKLWMADLLDFGPPEAQNTLRVYMAMATQAAAEQQFGGAL